MSNKSNFQPSIATMSTVSITNDLQPYLASLRSYLDQDENNSGSPPSDDHQADGSVRGQAQEKKPQNANVSVTYGCHSAAWREKGKSLNDNDLAQSWAQDKR